MTTCKGATFSVLLCFVVALVVFVPGRGVSKQLSQTQKGHLDVLNQVDSWRRRKSNKGKKGKKKKKNGKGEGKKKKGNKIQVYTRANIENMWKNLYHNGKIPRHGNKKKLNRRIEKTFKKLERHYNRNFFNKVLYEMSPYFGYLSKCCIDSTSTKASTNPSYSNYDPFYHQPTQTPTFVGHYDEYYDECTNPYNPSDGVPFRLTYDCPSATKKKCKTSYVHWLFCPYSCNKNSCRAPQNVYNNY